MKVVLSNPILVWLVLETDRTVLGSMYFGINFSVLKGENTRGMIKRKSTPNSVMSKNWSLLFPASFEAPMDPLADIWKVSAPPKIFLTISPGFMDNPKDWILLTETSPEKVKSNFFNGVKYILAVSVVSGFSIYSISGYLKVLRSLKCRNVLVRSMSLKTSPSAIKIASVRALGLYLSLS